MPLFLLFLQMYLGTVLWGPSAWLKQDTGLKIANLLLLMQSDQWLMDLECLLSGAVRLVFCVHHLHIMYVILAANDANRAASAQWDVHL